MRFSSGSLMFLMLLFMAVQYNDPDGLQWMFIYAVPAIWCAVATFWHLWFEKLAFRISLLGSIAASFAGVAYFWPLVPQFWRKDVWYEVESAREGMGLMIVAFVLLFTWYCGRRQRLLARQSGSDPVALS